MKSKERGITLIALVVTIIILLILAGASIQMLTGQNGILKQAKEAKERTEESSKQEEKDIEKLEIMMNNDLTEDEKQREIAKIEAKENTTNKEYEDKNGEKVLIPAGFAATDVPGENTVEDGFVITDGEGNEFVWIPCDGKSGVTYEGINGFAKTWTEKYKSQQINYLYMSVGPNGKEIENPGWGDAYGNNDSVSRYRGFYVGRYEAGVPSIATEFYANSNDAEYKYDTEKNITKYAPVSKKNNQSWNFISQEHAKIVSTKMYENSSSVKSQLIDSYAWDTIVKWFEKNYEGIGLSSLEYGNYSNNEKINVDALFAVHGISIIKPGQEGIGGVVWATKYNKGKITSGVKDVVEKDINKYNWDNIDTNKFSYTTRVELATGATESTKLNNIYDMAGNMWEWTTEESTTRQDPKKENKPYGVHRGGGFDAPEDWYAVSVRAGNFSTNVTAYNIGFRVVLYIK